jgi:hypothetical protein
MRPRGCTFALLVLAVACGRARVEPPVATAFQRCQAPELKLGDPVAYCALDVRPVFDPTGPLPRVPDILRSAGVSSVGRVTIVVDSAGRARVTRTNDAPANLPGIMPHALAAAALRASVPQLRFSPGRSAQGATATTLQFEVRMLVQGHDSIPTFPVVRQEEEPWGIRLTIGDEPVPKSARAPRYSKATVLEIHRAMIKAMLPLEESEGGLRATCVAIRQPDEKRWRHRDPEPELLAGFGIPNLFPHSKCPPSYWRMFVTLDSAGNPLPDPRPPGVLDPGSFSIEELIPWTETHAVAKVRTSRGGSGRILFCRAVRAHSSAREWTARCSGNTIWMA